MVNIPPFLYDGKGKISAIKFQPHLTGRFVRQLICKHLKWGRPVTFLKFREQSITMHTNAQSMCIISFGRFPPSTYIWALLGLFREAFTVVP